MCKSQIDRYNSAAELLRDLRRVKYSGNTKDMEDTALIQNTQIMPAINNGSEDNMKKNLRQRKKTEA